MKNNLLRYILSTMFIVAVTACETTPSDPKHSEQNSALPADKIFELIEMRYTYKNLKINDLDQMMDLMYAKVKEYKDTDQVQKLKEGVLIAYSRPDEDRTLDKLIAIVKNPLEDNSEWENTIQAMVQQNISRLHDEKTAPVYQATAGVVLENLIADLKPLFIKQYRSGGFETEMMQKIADSRVEYSKATKAERKLNLMRTNSSPSEIAGRLVEIKMQTLKNEKK